MKIRKALHEEYTVGDHQAFTEALAELVFAQAEMERQRDEDTDDYRLAEAAVGLAWNAVIATVDAYTSLRVAETIRLIGVRQAA